MARVAPHEPVVSLPRWFDEGRALRDGVRGGESITIVYPGFSRNRIAYLILSYHGFRKCISPYQE